MCEWPNENANKSLALFLLLWMMLRWPSHRSHNETPGHCCWGDNCFWDELMCKNFSSGTLNSPHIRQQTFPLHPITNGCCSMQIEKFISTSIIILHLNFEFSNRNDYVCLKFKLKIWYAIRLPCFLGGRMCQPNSFINWQAVESCTHEYRFTDWNNFPDEINCEPMVEPKVYSVRNVKWFNFNTEVWPLSDQTFRVFRTDRIIRFVQFCCVAPKHLFLIDKNAKRNEKKKDERITECERKKFQGRRKSVKKVTTNTLIQLHTIRFRAC